MIKITGINHIGVVAKDPRTFSKFLTEVLDLSFLGDDLVKEQQTLTSMFNTSHDAQDQKQARIEILQPQPSETGPIAKFIEKKGYGIHHIALHVDDIEEAIKVLKAKGVRLVDSAPRSGAHDTKIIFIHPESTGGILIELTESSLPSP